MERVGGAMTSDYKEIVFTITRDGLLEYAIKGYKGGACEDLSKLFESMGALIEEKKTYEYYEKDEDVTQKIRLKS